ncbi:50S ribosomal protein L11 methyltransferase [Aurantimonas sp. CSK15Z-1]|nr:50S ribosomal protein L11 methyltransferase [Aurantimonas sp. CSK15Z-1]MCQ8781491.1 50S ribosomal protein L11 methyltransferase [Aurantimonas sp. CSK15Z-1]
MGVTQVRYFLRAGKAEAQAAYGRLEAAYEDEAAPLSIFEIDEARGEHEVSVYFEADGGDRSQEVADAAGVARVEREDLPDVDWMEQVLADLKPVRAGRFLVHGAHDRARVKPNDLSIEIEAGQAFGTGHHETTAGCLEAIDRILSMRMPQNALDLGTGSGVLAIALALRGRVPVLATDIDPVAVRVAQENVRANRVHTLVQTAVATGLSAAAIRDQSPYDLIVANILAGPLMRLAPGIARALTRDGDLVLSGILGRQRNAVLAAYRVQGLFHRHTLWRGDWVTLHLTR